MNRVFVLEQTHMYTFKVFHNRAYIHCANRYRIVIRNNTQHSPLTINTHENNENVYFTHNVIVRYKKIEVRYRYSAPPRDDILFYIIKNIQDYVDIKPFALSLLKFLV